MFLWQQSLAKNKANIARIHYFFIFAKRLDSLVNK